MIASTLSRRPPVRFWGWGLRNEALTKDEDALVRSMARQLARDGLQEVAPPAEQEFSLAGPRLAAPGALQPLLSTSRYDRLAHTYGKSYADGARMFLRQAPNPPDLVAFPQSEQDVVDILDWASRANAAVIPYGGGSSVCGGVEPAVGDSFSGTVSLDLESLDRVIEVDAISRAARIQAGALGPALEAQLKPHGLTLRHFPQSFQFSTLGGWLATRAGGHYASLYTHIDDFVEATRTITPSGVLETRRLPGSGAGPSADRMIIGSEGVLGVITEAWMRLQHRPVYRASVPVRFADMITASGAVRALSQSGLFPTNCRLLDEHEVLFNRLGDGRSALLVLGFESADHPVDAWLARALELVSDHGGRRGETEAGETGPADRPADAAAAWRQAFIRMPYYRNLLTGLGVIADTFETAITWDRFEALYRGVRERVGGVIEEVTGGRAMLSCRFTHVYPDGPAPYFTFFAAGSTRGDLGEALAKWRQIKAAANEAVVALGGTVTHHHAVGRDHRSGYEAQSSLLFRQALAAAKQSLDPEGILNPGVLIDPADRNVGITGVLAGA